MRRKIEIETSQFSPGAYWKDGAEYYAEIAIVEYPDELDHLDDDDLLGLADEEEQGVRYVEAEVIIVTEAENKRIEELYAEWDKILFVRDTDHDQPQREPDGDVIFA